MPEIMFLIVSSNGTLVIKLYNTLFSMIKVIRLEGEQSDPAIGRYSSTNFQIVRHRCLGFRCAAACIVVVVILFGLQLLCLDGLEPVSETRRSFIKSS